MIDNDALIVLRVAVRLTPDRARGRFDASDILDFSGPGGVAAWVAQFGTASARERVETALSALLAEGLILDEGGSEFSPDQQVHLGYSVTDVGMRLVSDGDSD